LLFGTCRRVFLRCKCLIRLENLACGRGVRDGLES
jgi:hypothetical protein